MKTKDYVYIVAYVLFFGFFITTLVEELRYQDEQFKKINKLNNDLLKISQYVQPLFSVTVFNLHYTSQFVMRRSSP